MRQNRRVKNVRYKDLTHPFERCTPIPSSSHARRGIEAVVSKREIEGVKVADIKQYAERGVLVQWNKGTLANMRTGRSPTGCLGEAGIVQPRKKPFRRQGFTIGPIQRLKRKELRDIRYHRVSTLGLRGSDGEKRERAGGEGYRKAGARTATSKRATLVAEYLRCGAGALGRTSKKVAGGGRGAMASLSHENCCVEALVLLGNSRSGVRIEGENQARGWEGAGESRNQSQAKTSDSARGQINFPFWERRDGREKKRDLQQAKEKSRIITPRAWKTSRSYVRDESLSHQEK